MDIPASPFLFFNICLARLNAIPLGLLLLKSVL